MSKDTATVYLVYFNNTFHAAFATIEDATDGSGDKILIFPEGFCESEGWKVGDTLDLTLSSDGNLIISKK